MTWLVQYLTRLTMIRHCLRMAPQKLVVEKGSILPETPAAFIWAMIARMYAAVALA